MAPLAWPGLLTPPLLPLPAQPFVSMPPAGYLQAIEEIRTQWQGPPFTDICMVRGVCVFA